MNEDPEKNNEIVQSLEKYDPVFLEAHSVHSELYHSTVQIPAYPQQNDPHPFELNPIEPQIYPGGIPSRSGSQLKPEMPKRLMEKEQLNEDSTSCVDTFCLVIAFFVVLGSMICFIVILTKGNENELQVSDSYGNICGSSETKDYPYLFMVNISDGQTSSGICVSLCPNSSSTAVDSFSSENQTYYDTVSFQNPDICVPVATSLLSLMEYALQYNSLNVIVFEFQSSYVFFLYSVGFSVSVGTILIILIRVMKRLAIYVLLTIEILILLATGVLMVVYSVIYNENSLDDDSIEKEILESFYGFLNYNVGYLILGIALITYGIFWFFQMVVFWRNEELDKISKLLKTAKDINKQYKFLFLIAIFSYLLTVLFLGLLIIFFSYLVPLYSSSCFSFNDIASVSSSTETIVYKLMAYFSVPVTMWLCSSFLSFSQFTLAVLSVAKYFPPVNPTLADHKSRIFSNKLNYHIGSIFLAGFGNLLSVVLGFFLTILLIFLKACQKCCPSVGALVNQVSFCYDRMKEKFSGNGFIIIALSNTSLAEANDLVSKITEKNKTRYPISGHTGDIFGLLCGSIVFCGVCLLGLGLLIDDLGVSVSFLPLFSYAGLGYFCGVAISEQYWYEINVIYILFCICEEVLGKREENQYSYENQIVHSKINDIGGIYSIIKISRENEQFSHVYNQMN